MMRLTKPLVRLPILFDAGRLAAEVTALPTSAWDPHPNGFPGNEAVRLVSPEGKATDALRGAMGPTEHLLASPYMMDADA